MTSVRLCTISINNTLSLQKLLCISIQCNQIQYNDPLAPLYYFQYHCTLYLWYTMCVLSSMFLGPIIIWTFFLHCIWCTERYTLIYTDDPHTISCNWQKTWDCGNASDLRPSRSSQLQISFLNHLNFCAGNHLKLKLGHMSCLLHRACVELALWAFCFAPRLDSCALSIVYNVNLGAEYT